MNRLSNVSYGGSLKHYPLKTKWYLLHPAEENAAQQEHSYGKEGNDPKIKIKGKDIHVEQRASNAVHSIGKRVELY